MKLNKTAMAVGAILLSGSALAEISANVGVTSNYVFRGVTLSDDGPAVSGGLDYAHDSGFYLGTWGSSMTSDTGEEVDLYGGFGGAMGDIGYDVNVYYYWYPSLSESDYAELSGSLSYSFFTAGVAYTFYSQVDEVAGQADGFIEGDIYYYLSASYEVMPTWTLGGTVGYYDFDDDGDAGEDISYKHFQVDVGKSAGDFGDFTFSVSFADEESGDDDPIVFVSWGKTF